MKVEKIQSNQNFRMSLKLNRKAAYDLAEDFVNNPKLENTFIRKVAKPLEKSDTDVVYNGYSTYYKHKNDKDYSAIISGYPKDYVVAPLTGPLAYSRTGYRPKDSSKLIYTNDFANFRNTKAQYRDIEAAKNIGLNIDAEASGRTLDFYETPNNYDVPKTGKTLIEKFEWLVENFGI